MLFTWNENKRRSNIGNHGLDFVDCARVFDGFTYTFEDARLAYEEARFVTLGFLDSIPVSIVHTETPTQIHIISFRKATRHEESILLESLKN